MTCVRRVVKRKIGNDTEEQLTVKYLSKSLKIPCLAARVMAGQVFGRRKLSIIVPMPGETPDLMAVLEHSRSATIRLLRTGLRTYNNARLVHVPDQGKVLIWSSQPAYSNYFMLTRLYILFFSIFI